MGCRCDRVWHGGLRSATFALTGGHCVARRACAVHTAIAHARPTRKQTGLLLLMARYLQLRTRAMTQPREAPKSSEPPLGCSRCRYNPNGCQKCRDRPDGAHARSCSRSDGDRRADVAEGPSCTARPERRSQAGETPPRAVPSSAAPQPVGRKRPAQEGSLLCAISLGCDCRRCLRLLSLHARVASTAAIGGRSRGSADAGRHDAPASRPKRPRPEAVGASVMPLQE